MIVPYPGNRYRSVMRWHFRLPAISGPWGTQDAWGRAFLFAALGWTLALPLSIALAETLLWAAALIWAADWLRRELAHASAPPAPPAGGPSGDIFALIGAPLMAFWGVSVISALASRDPVESLWELRSTFLFAAPLVTYLAYRNPNVRRLGLRLFAAGVLLAIVVGLVSTFMAVGAGDFPGEYRPAGTLGHYMTYAGALMLAVPVLLIIDRGRLGGQHRIVAVAAVVVIGLTMTRSAWVGCFVGLLVWFGARFVPGRISANRTRQSGWAAYGTLLVIAVVLGGVLLLSLAGPDALLSRGASIFSLDNPTNVDRLAMAATGLRIIRAHPFLGIGPGLMARVYPAWRVEWAVKDDNPHLHNVALQIGAERGLLGLASWVWLMAAIAVGAWRVLRYSGPFGEGGPEARAALAALAAFLVMGLFEYNFSDSEVLMILLYAATLPYAASSGIVLAEHDGEL